MKKIIILWCLCYFTNLFAQSKYFEKSHGWDYVQSGMASFQQSNGQYITIALFYTQENINWQTASVKFDNYGNLVTVNQYPDPIYRHLAFTLKENNQKNGYIIPGVKENTNTNHLRSYIITLDNNIENQTEHLIGNEETSNRVTDVIQTSDNGYLLAGFYIPVNSIYWQPYLIKLDSLYNKEWEKMYTDYAMDKHNYFLNILPSENGGAYIIGTTDLDFINGDAILLKVDSLGNKIWEKKYDFENYEQGGRLQRTHDKGFILVAVPKKNYEEIIRVDSLGNVLWTSIGRHFLGGGVGNLVVLEDTTYLFVGGYENEETEDDHLDIELLKLDDQGNMLWKRHYGGNRNEYGRDILQTQDGGFLITGRTESNLPQNQAANVYLLKTNCMGLLTEPIAQFNTNLQDYTLTLTNLSQYVYPDSIDGGHYHWDFGDGQTSNTFEPTHTYQTAGFYDVTLKAIVCSDTSIMTQTLQVGSVGLPNTASSFYISSPYPYPITNKSSLDYDLQSYPSATLSIYDLTGRLVNQTNLQGKGSYIINATDYESGIYFYIIQTKDKVLSSDKFSIIR